MKNIIKRLGITRIIAIIFWILIIIGFLGLKYYFKLGNIEIIHIIINYIKQNPLSWIIFILIYTFRQFLFIPGSVFIMATPFLFGLPQAFVLTIIAVNISSTVSYFVGKYLDFIDIQKLRESKNMKMLKKIEEKPFLYVIISKLLFLNTDLVSYFCGFLEINFNQFFWASLIGSIPVEISIVWAGIGIEHIKGFNIHIFNIHILNLDYKLFICSLILIILISSLIYIRSKKKK